MCAVTLVFATGAVLVATTSLSGVVLAPVLGAALLAVFAIALIVDVRS